jgi:hypothetical protein
MQRTYLATKTDYQYAKKELTPLQGSNFIIKNGPVSAEFSIAS